MAGFFMAVSKESLRESASEGFGFWVGITGNGDMCPND